MTLWVWGRYPNGGFDVKIIIWGLSLAAKYMIESQQFCDRRFFLRFGTVVVGELGFHTRRADDVDVEAIIAPFFQGDSIAQTGSDNVSVGTTVVGIPYTFSVGTIPGPALDVGDIVMTLLGGFEDVAFRGIGRQVPSGEFTTALGRYRIVLDFHVIVPPPGEAPAWFTYEVVWNAMDALVKR